MNQNDLAKSMEPIVASWNDSGHHDASTLHTLLFVSAGHVVSSDLGVSLFDHAEAIAFPNAEDADVFSKQLAAYLLVFGSGETSIDLCASALLRWHGQLPTSTPEREWDFSALDGRVGSGKVGLSDEQRTWFQEAKAGREQLKQFRHAAVHRFIRQDANVGGSPSVAISPYRTAAGKEETALTLRRQARFAAERWRQFWPTLVP